MRYRKVRLGLFGIGTVGCGLVELIRNRKEKLKRTDGTVLEIVKAVVRDTAKKRRVDTGEIALDSDPDFILNDPEIDIVVEVVGGESPADRFVRSALANGKHVVTANKALLAAQGEALMELARRNRVAILAEASVGSGIPVLKTIRESFVANDIVSVLAIVNGTTNYVLTKMAEEGLSYFEALKMADDAGFTEADPETDVDGTDAQQKLRILAAYICDGVFPQGEITCRGITDLTPSDIDFAERRQMTIKLLAKAKKREQGLELKVEPTLLPKQHPLANVRNEYNAFLLVGDSIGESILVGKGAGALPAASAIYADIMDICHKRQTVASGFRAKNAKPARILPSAGSTSEYYMRFTVDDRPGLIGAIATILGNHDISVSNTSAELIPNSPGLGQVHVMAHATTEQCVFSAIEEIRRVRGIHQDCKFLPVVSS